VNEGRGRTTGGEGERGEEWRGAIKAHGRRAHRENCIDSTVTWLSLGGLLVQHKSRPDMLRHTARPKGGLEPPQLVH
jgi:hypothetical protein